MQQTQLETLEKLERRVNFTVSEEDIEKAMDARLKRIARTAKISGFRPGKAPLKIVAQHYGHAVHEEAMNEVVKRVFTEAVQAHNLRIAGVPQFEAKAPTTQGEIAFSAKFEVFPEIGQFSLTDLKIEKPVLDVTGEEVDKTIEILRKQRLRYEDVTRKSKAKDRIIIDFTGKIDGVAFSGGSAENYAFVIDEKQMLPEFEEAAKGLKTGEEKTFDLAFPEDYHGKEVAGKTAQFTIVVKNVAAPILPEIDAEFAKSLGVADGNVEKMRQEIQQNIEREVKMRLRANTLNKVTEALLEAIPLDLPQSLVAQEMDTIIKAMLENLKSRGLDPSSAPFPADIGEKVKKQAESRVHLTLLLTELVRAHQLETKPEQVKAIVQNLAESYENPAEVVQWYYESQERLSQVRQMALEDNVVAYVLSQAKVTEEKIAFESLMETHA